MVEAFEASAKEAKAAGKIADYVVLNGDGSVAQQNSQIAELILKGVDAIAVDAASETAVNGIIEKACAAGIKVVTLRFRRLCALQLPAQFRLQGLQAGRSRMGLQEARRQGQRAAGARRQRLGAGQRHVQRAGSGVEEISRHQGRRDRLRTGDGLGGAIGDRQRSAEPAARRCGARPGRQRRFRHRAGVRPVRRRLQGQAADHRGRRQHRFHQVVGGQERAAATRRSR